MSLVVVIGLDSSLFELSWMSEVFSFSAGAWISVVEVGFVASCWLILYLGPFSIGLIISGIILSGVHFSVVIALIYVTFFSVVLCFLMLLTLSTKGKYYMFSTTSIIMYVRAKLLIRMLSSLSSTNVFRLDKRNNALQLGLLVSLKCHIWLFDPKVVAVFIDCW